MRIGGFIPATAACGSMAMFIHQSINQSINQSNNQLVHGTQTMHNDHTINRHIQDNEQRIFIFYNL